MVYFYLRGDYIMAKKNSKTNKKRVLNIGIDVGSTTVKVLVCDERLNELFSSYQRHFSNTKKTLIELLNKVE